MVVDVTKLIYYCVNSGVEMNSSNLLGDVSEMTLTQLEELGVGLNVGIAWEEALHSALMPITPQASMGSLAESKCLEIVRTVELYCNCGIQLCITSVNSSQYLAS